LSGVVIGGGMAAVNPLAPLVFLALARKAGSVLSDPVALRLMNDALGVDEQLKILSGKKIRGKKYGTGAYRNVTPKLTAAGLTQKREAFARFMNYLNDEDEDMPRINPKTIDPIRIQEELLGMPFENVKPRYDDNTIPKETIESMFAQDFTAGSGNVETDNQIVDYIQSSIRNTDETDADQESRNQEAERASVMGDIELENPVQQPQVTGQVNAQQFQALFPNDPTGAAIAMRGNKRV
jgi:hypothetical protein